MSLYALSVWLHVVAATAWVGSMLFFSAVVIPVARRLDGRAPGIILLLGQRYRSFGWIALAVLLVTGVTNLHFRGIGWSLLASNEFWATSFGRALGWKLVFVGVVLSLTAVHDVSSRRPSSSGPAERDASSPEAVGARRRASWLGRIVLLASLAILFFATALVRGFL